MKRKYAGILAAALFGAVTLTVSLPRRLMLNLTPSLPRGLYYVSSRTPSRNDCVLINSDRLAFNNGLRNVTLLKRIAFAAGDQVSVTGDALIVNDGVPFRKYRPLGVTGEWVLRDGQAVLLGDHPRSFDSRYFGPVSIADCTRVVPLLLLDRRDAP
jgi:conjugative transfer signal peptidase TraF